jgi:macrolide transport system ATP-binding/permease protein
VLAAAGGVLGMVIAWWASGALQGLMATDVFPIPISFEFAIDRTVLMFAVAASLVTAVVFGLAPAWSASRPELVPALKASAEGDERTRFSTRDVLVLGQVTLSTVLLVAGALLARGLAAAQGTDLGYDPRPLSSLTFNLAMNGYDDARAGAFQERALETLRALPGVLDVSTASRLPLSPDINMDGIRIPGHHRAEEQETPVDTVVVGAGYFTTVDVPIVTGRAFTRDDHHRRVVIVNEAFARQYWPGGNAVGERIYRGGYHTTAWEIVGIARDHKVRSVGEQPRPYLHIPGQWDRAIGLIVRTSTPAEAALPMLRNALWSLEPDIVFTEDVPAEQVAATTVLPTRVGAIVLGAFGILALILAAVGLYGVVAYSVSRRTREIGIRMALGAPRAAVLRLLASRGVVVAFAGLAAGALIGAAVGRLLEAMLYGISAFDGIAFAIAAAVLLTITGVANLVPTLSAMRIDPVRALRSE